VLAQAGWNAASCFMNLKQIAEVTKQIKQDIGTQAWKEAMLVLGDLLTDQGANQTTIDVGAKPGYEACCDECAQLTLAGLSFLMAAWPLGALACLLLKLTNVCGDAGSLFPKADVTKSGIA
jgi:hypothetical protein